ncbi:endonuclease/exonuclease/phosphatase family protein [Rossellomorea marisflavi]|uniref:endonuclease/exonuclease/phosphatase family protein n=1 Tax=Rossellomorea marisflavi TaxID=189381 RepID=UPI00345B3BE6
MKLLTLNCHSWLEDNQWEKLGILADTIAEKEYDVIALQEVNQLISEEEAFIKKDNFALILLQELKKRGVTGYSFIWDYAHVGYDRFEEGAAILTRHPILEEHRFHVSSDEDLANWKTRKIIGITIPVHDEKVTFYSCHLGWWQDEEEPFMSQVDRLFEKAAGPFFLMGDFNNDANTRGEGYDYLIKKGLWDTFHLTQKRDEGTTILGDIAGWDGNERGLRIDLILSSRKTNVHSSAVIFNGTNRPIISDHYGVEVELDW